LQTFIFSQYKSDKQIVENTCKSGLNDDLFHLKLIISNSYPFQFDLPTAGVYIISLSLGFASNSLQNKLQTWFT